MNRFHDSHFLYPVFRSLLFYLPFFTLAPMLLCSPAVVFSQQTWERDYGGAGTEEGFSVQQTSDGGYIVSGRTCSFATNQVYLVKTNASGDTLWTRNYGGTEDELGYSVQQTSDGGYIIAGGTDSFGNGFQVYLIKTNASGDTLWTKTYGGAAEDWGYSVRQTLDGGYIVAGTTSSFGNISDVYLLKTTSSGDTLWTRTYGGAGWEGGSSVQQTGDSGYVIAGQTYSFGAGGSDVYLIKTNARGDTLWTRAYGGTTDDAGGSVQQTSDGGYVVAGMATSFGSTIQAYLIKTNASGDTLWTRNYGGGGTDDGNSVQQTSDGGYIAAGSSNSYGNGVQVYLIKTNAGGDTLWTRSYGLGRGDDQGSSVQQTSDMGYIIAGTTTSFGNGYQVYLIKTDSIGRYSSGVEENKGFEGPRVQGIKITPNPFTSFTILPGHEAERFSLYDITGRKVGIYRGDRIGEGLSQGVYFVRREGEGGSLARVVKIR